MSRQLAHGKLDPGRHVLGRAVLRKQKKKVIGEAGRRGPKQKKKKKSIDLSLAIQVHFFFVG